MIVNPPTCLRCGAPYREPIGPWWSVTPPRPMPTCTCFTGQAPTIVARTAPVTLDQTHAAPRRFQ